MPPPRSDPTEAAAALTAVAPLVTRWMERLLARHDPPLTVTQYLTLRAIAHEGVSDTELARRAGVSGPAISQLLAGLTDARLLERKVVEDDRRRSSLALSPAGERAFETAEKILGERLGALLADLRHPDAAALSRVLPRVENALSAAAPPRRPPHPRPPPPPPPPPGPRPRGRRP